MPVIRRYYAGRRRRTGQNPHKAWHKAGHRGRRCTRQKESENACPPEKLVARRLRQRRAAAAARPHLRARAYAGAAARQAGTAAVRSAARTRRRQRQHGRTVHARPPACERRQHGATLFKYNMPSREGFADSAHVSSARHPHRVARSPAPPPRICKRQAWQRAWRSIPAQGTDAATARKGAHLQPGRSSKASALREMPVERRQGE